MFFKDKTKEVIVDFQRRVPYAPCRPTIKQKEVEKNESYQFLALTPWRASPGTQSPPSIRTCSKPSLATTPSWKRLSAQASETPSTPSTAGGEQVVPRGASPAHTQLVGGFQLHLEQRRTANIAAHNADHYTPPPNHLTDPSSVLPIPKQLFLFITCIYFIWFYS